MKEMLNLNIDKNGLDFINMLLEKSPEAFSNISKNISVVLQDGVLNSDDVPTLIHLIKDIMNINKKQIARNMLTVDNVIIFVKTLLEVLIVKNIVKVINKEKIFQLIDISFTLLTTSIDTSESIMDCAGRYFKCI
jgi:hypothetical protein